MRWPVRPALLSSAAPRARSKPLLSLSWLLAASVFLSSPAFAETPLVLDRASVVQLAARQSPEAKLAQLRTEEARAARTGAGTLAPFNPEVSLTVGPRRLGGSTETDYFVGLVWPIDVSGTASKRTDLANARTKLAESEAALAIRVAAVQTFALWVRARSAEERAQLESARLAADQAISHAAQVRRAAGTVGDGDVALARALEAQSQARLVTTQQERDATLARLRVRIGVPAATPVVLRGSLVSDPPLPLEALLARLHKQPTIARSMAALRVAQSDVQLQQRAGWPVPRLTAATGKDPDTFAHFGVDVPLPIYQRNQTNAAVSVARSQTAEIEYRSALAYGEAELRAAYAEYQGAQDAFRTLDAVTPSIDDAERLAIRGYELGQSTLTELASTRREVAAARTARLDAEVALANARLTLDALTGALE